MLGVRNSFTQVDVVACRFGTRWVWPFNIIQHHSTICILSFLRNVTKEWISKTSASGWWFGTFFTFPYTVLGIIIPIDFHIFQRGGPTTNQIWCHHLKTCRSNLTSQIPVPSIPYGTYLALKICLDLESVMIPIGRATIWGIDRRDGTWWDMMGRLKRIQEHRMTDFDPFTIEKVGIWWNKYGNHWQFHVNLNHVKLQTIQTPDIRWPCTPHPGWENYGERSRRHGRCAAAQDADQRGGAVCLRCLADGENMMGWWEHSEKLPARREGMIHTNDS